MDLGALTYALHRDIRPSLLVVTDLNQERLDRAASLFPPKEWAEKGIALHFVNTGKYEDPVAELMRISGGTGYDDVLCYAPVAAVVTQSSAILGRDGCLNFFAGPTDKKFSATMNFYDVHYNSTHVMGTTGGNTADMLKSLQMTAESRRELLPQKQAAGGPSFPPDPTKHRLKAGPQQKTDRRTAFVCPFLIVGP